MHWGPIGPQKRRYHILSAHPQANGNRMARTCVACMLILDRCGIVNGQYRGQEVVCVAEPPRHWAICRHVRPSRSMHTERTPDQLGCTATMKQSDRLRPLMPLVLSVSPTFSESRPWRVMAENRRFGPHLQPQRAARQSGTR
jgi:hypothetical protein